jgi:DHA2 family multidrug resistance protein
MLANRGPGIYAGTQAVAALDRAVTGQATMIAYLDDFQLMLILTLLSLPLLLLVRSPRSAGAEVKHAALE